MSRRPSSDASALSSWSLASTPVPYSRSSTSTPAPSSRSTCASVTDDSEPSSLLARVAQVRASHNLGRVGVPECAREDAKEALARYGTAGRDGTLQMSSQEFSSLCKDCGFLDDRLASHVNLIFARATRPGFVMDAEQLVVALSLIAKRKGCSESVIHEALSDHLGDLPPHISARVPAAPNAGMQIEERATLDSFREVLTSRDAVLLKGGWLLELCSSGGILPARCELPEAAAWSADVIDTWKNYIDRRANAKKTSVAAVSCFWLTLGHPDPEGQHLRALCQSIRQRLGHTGRKGNSQPRADDIAIFWDYACLRPDPSGHDLERSLERREMWLRHPDVEVWILSEDSPGTSICETSICEKSSCQ
eukprot:TRINITY_DN21290_c0_g1_i1.p1 TRINITY_DN21290_c0_g1~~TRINITY_DN21290_c0_g1_i1.p1  ORF type:complete len:364 (-),score=44.59 TRINITY_DN21290_c0_g1_i1:372-1463(-)